MLQARIAIAGLCMALAAATAMAQPTRSKVRGAQLRPNPVAVRVNQSVGLTVQFCDFEMATDDLQPVGAGYNCRDDPDDFLAPALEQPSVNGIVGGSAALGRVRASDGHVYYTAPARPPARNPVTVSVAMPGTSATGRPTKTVLTAEVRVLPEDKAPPPEALPTRYTGSGTISFTTGTGAGLFRYSATFEVAGERAPGGVVGEYSLPGTVVVSEGEMGLPNCQCRITGGGTTGEAGLIVITDGKQQSFSVSAYVTVGLSCTPSGARRTCPSSNVVAITWTNRGRPDCPGSTVTTYTDVQTLTGGYQRTCGTTQETASWTLTGEYAR